MSRRFNFSWRNLNIRDKLLSSYAVMILVIMVINLTVSLTAFRYIRIFDDRLTVYFDIQEFRMALLNNYRDLEQYLRDRSESVQSRYYTAIPALWQRYQRVSLRADTGKEAFFQIRAIERGLTEYLSRAGIAIRNRDLGGTDYYQAFVNTQRVYQYLTGYVEILMNENLNSGSETYGIVAAHAANVRFISFVSIAGVGIAFIIFGLLFSNSVSRPIHRLADLAARIAAGDLEVGSIPVKSRDEVGILSAAFNTMSRSIREMVEGLKEKADLERQLHEEEIALERMQRTLQEARFMGLQAQINPHFLFNALNTISRTALFEGADKTAQLIKSVAALFRYHLRDPRKTVRFSEELMILEEYLSLQRYRFGDRLRYSVNCSVPAESLMVPAFILQPLVENAVKHGIEPREEGGEVKVEAYFVGDRVSVVITDTGCGMSPEKVQEILLAARAGGGGIGLSNVIERLALFYQGKEEFNLQSEEEAGTRVTLSFPAVHDGDVGCIHC